MCLAQQIGTINAQLINSTEYKSYMTANPKKSIGEKLFSDARYYFLCAQRLGGVRVQNMPDYARVFACVDKKA